KSLFRSFSYGKTHVFFVFESGHFQRCFSWIFLIAILFFILYSCVGIPWLRSGEISPGYHSLFGHNIKTSVQIFFIWENPWVFSLLKVVAFRVAFLRNF